MNPLTLVKRIQKINSQEASLGISEEASWHVKYRDSAYVFVGGIPYDLTEGDLLAVFAQYGEVVDVNLVRDKGTGKSKGFAFVAYEDQRSTNLAVDNLNGSQILGRIIRVDHVTKYKKKEEEDEETEQKNREARGVCRAFQRGECTRGAGCKFSHDEQRAANTGWGAAEDAGAKWGHDKFDDPKHRDRELHAKGRKNSDDLERHPREISGRHKNKLKGWDDGKESEFKPREDHGSRRKDENREISGRQENKLKGQDDEQELEFKSGENGRKDEKRLRRNDVDDNRELKLEDDRYKREEKRTRRNHDDGGKEEKKLRRHDDDDEMKLEDKDHYKREEKRSRKNHDNELPQHSRRDYNNREENGSRRRGDEEYQLKSREDDSKRERDVSVKHRSESYRRENQDEKRDFRSSHGRDSSSLSHRERNEDRRR